ncbi:class I SAM-dependent methyltransferase [Candidatus Uabimicrobium amorphum]|uniref:Methyltransferase type 11 domain-containing protein n=1 Tax=Uabimicrobium amorphum TaxID=2596890 RepID=A0A5S9IP85_UABAM|nr:class I SAM-dependent methyltransferase [Candidatus Uabimicrobium amorphum]BBM85096.1 hypothetical protein UABAM_03459 [Candidatus Uabimicrobium amorphum]
MSTYIGNELELFAKATNWKQYYAKYLRPHIKGHVLEVGAGIGGTTTVLCDQTQESWTCLEPDEYMAEQIELRVKDNIHSCSVIAGTIDDLPQNATFDTIMYIDVIEHIANDRDEILRATQRLKPQGKLIILVPAHQWLFSPFDKEIGHFRRYNKKMLRSIMPTSLKETSLFYLDSVGMFASIANKFILKQLYPTSDQIRFWDKTMLPISKIFDAIIFYTMGKSLIGVWKKQ